MSGSWSNTVTTSLTLPTGATNPQQRIVLDGSTDTILVYNNAGALIASVAAAAGTDGFGNSYPAGISSTGGVISQSIILVYSGTPAAGNLISSIASTAGTDSFGNHYVAGIGSYDNTGLTFAQVIGADFKAGQFGQGNVPDTTNAASFSSLAGIPGVALLSSGFDPPNAPNAAQIELLSGENSQTTGSGNCPTIVTGGSTSPGATASDVDWLHGGSIIRVLRTSGLQETWLTPTAAANWTIGTLQYRLNIEDEVRWIGSATYTGANVTGAGASTINVNVGPSHRPKAQWKVPVVHYTSTSVQKNVASSAQFNTDGTVTIQWGDGMAGTTHDANGLATGDIFWIEANIPMGNIP